MKAKQVLTFLLLLLIFRSFNCLGQNHFEVDSLFANSGIGTSNTNIMNSFLKKVFKDLDGSYLVCSNESYFYFEPPLWIKYHSITKFNTCGQIDSSYGINGKYTFDFSEVNNRFSTSNSFIKGNSNSIISSGYFTEYVVNNVPWKRPYINIIDNEGHVLSDFETDVIINSLNGDTSDIDIEILSTEIDNDTNYLSSFIYYNNNLISIGFINNLYTGQTNSNFGNNGILKFEISNEISNIQSVEKIGNDYFFVGYDNDYKLSIIKTIGTSQIDSSFGVNGLVKVVERTVYEISTLVSEDKLVIANISYPPRIEISKYNIEGQLDTIFGNFSMPVNSVNEVNESIIGIDTIFSNKLLVGSITIGVPWIPINSTNYVIDSAGALDTTVFTDGQINISYNGSPVAIGKSIKLDENNIMLFGMYSSPGMKGLLITKFTDMPNSFHINQNNDSLTIDVEEDQFEIEWYLNQDLIGSNTNSIQLIGVGNYSVRIVDSSNCIELSDSIDVISLNTEYINNQIPYVIYPNPNEGIFNVSNVEILENYSVFSIDGRLIQTGNIDYQNNLISIDDLSTGVYYLTMASGDVTKFVVMKRANP